MEGLMNLARSWINVVCSVESLTPELVSSACRHLSDYSEESANVFWALVQQDFNARFSASKQSQELQNQWEDLRQSVAKFHQILTEFWPNEPADRLDTLPSEKHHKILKQALQELQKRSGEEFKYLGVWNILVRHPKWEQVLEPFVMDTKSTATTARETVTFHNVKTSTRKSRRKRTPRKTVVPEIVVDSESEEKESHPQEMEGENTGRWACILPKPTACVTPTSSDGQPAGASGFSLTRLSKNERSAGTKEKKPRGVMRTATHTEYAEFIKRPREIPSRSGTSEGGNELPLGDQDLDGEGIRVGIKQGVARSRSEGRILHEKAQSIRHAKTMGQVPEAQSESSTPIGDSELLLKDQVQPEKGTHLGKRQRVAGSKRMVPRGVNQASRHVDVASQLREAASESSTPIRENESLLEDQVQADENIHLIKNQRIACSKQRKTRGVMHTSNFADVIGQLHEASERSTRIRDSGLPLQERIQDGDDANSKETPEVAEMDTTSNNSPEASQIAENKDLQRVENEDLQGVDDVHLTLAWIGVSCSFADAIPKLIETYNSFWLLVATYYYDSRMNVRWSGSIENILKERWQQLRYRVACFHYMYEDVLAERNDPTRIDREEVIAQALEAYWKKDGIWFQHRAVWEILERHVDWETVLKPLLLQQDDSKVSQTAHPIESIDGENLANNEHEAGQAEKGPQKKKRVREPISVAGVDKECHLPMPTMNDLHAGATANPSPQMAQWLALSSRRLELDIMTQKGDGLAPEALEYLSLQRQQILQKARLEMQPGVNALSVAEQRRTQ